MLSFYNPLQLRFNFPGSAIASTYFLFVDPCVAALAPSTQALFSGSKDGADDRELDESGDI